MQIVSLNLFIKPVTIKVVLASPHSLHLQVGSNSHTTENMNAKMYTLVLKTLFIICEVRYVLFGLERYVTIDTN